MDGLGQPAALEPIVQLETSRIALYGDEIRLCNVDGSTRRAIPFTSIDLIGARRMVSSSSVVVAVIGALLALGAWYASTMWIQIPLGLLAAGCLFLGLPNVWPPHLLLYHNGTLVHREACFDTAAEVDAFAANTVVALAIYRQQRSGALP